MHQSVITPVSIVETRGCKFVIFDAPNDANLPMYLQASYCSSCLPRLNDCADAFGPQELTKLSVAHVVRVCDPTYGTRPLEEAGIEVHVRDLARCLSRSLRAGLAVPRRRPSARQHHLQVAGGRRRSPWVRGRLTSGQSQGLVKSTFVDKADPPKKSKQAMKISSRCSSRSSFRHRYPLCGRSREVRDGSSAHEAAVHLFPPTCPPAVHLFGAADDVYRAPVLVAIALIEKGMDPLDAVQVRACLIAPPCPHLRARPSEEGGEALSMRSSSVSSKVTRGHQTWKGRLFVDAASRKSKKDCCVM